MCITKPIDKLVDKLLKHYNMNKREKETTGLFFAAIVGSAVFGFLGNLVANFIWNIILGNASYTDKQYLFGWGFMVLFIILIIVYWRLVVRLFKGMK